MSSDITCLPVSFYFRIYIYIFFLMGPSDGIALCGMNKVLLN